MMPDSENNDMGGDALLNTASKLASTVPNPMSMIQGGGSDANIMSAFGAKSESHNKDTSDKKGEMVKDVAKTAIKVAALL